MSVSEPLAQSILLGDAVEHAPFAFLVADEDMRYVAVNAYACELLGYSREELLGLQITDIALDDAAPARFAQMLAAGKLEGMTTVARKDGHELTVRFRAGETAISGLTYYVWVGWPEP